MSTFPKPRSEERSGVKGETACESAVMYCQMLTKYPYKISSFHFYCEFYHHLLFFSCPSSWSSWYKAVLGSTENIPQGQVTPYLVLPRAMTQGWPNKASGSAYQCLTQAPGKQQLLHWLPTLRPWHHLGLWPSLFWELSAEMGGGHDTSFVEATPSIWDKAGRCYEAAFWIWAVRNRMWPSDRLEQMDQGWPDFRKALLPEQNYWSSGLGRVSALLACSSPVWLGLHSSVKHVGSEKWILDPGLC